MYKQVRREPALYPFLDISLLTRPCILTGYIQFSKHKTWNPELLLGNLTPSISDYMSLLEINSPSVSAGTPNWPSEVQSPCTSKHPCKSWFGRSITNTKLPGISIYPLLLFLWYLRGFLDAPLSLLTLYRSEYPVPHCVNNHSAAIFLQVLHEFLKKLHT